MIPAPLAIIDVDLAIPLRDIPRPPNVVGACLVFWFGGRPWGRTLCAAGEFPLPPPTVASMAAAAIGSAVGSQVAPESFPPVLPDAGIPAFEKLSPLRPSSFARPLAELLAPDEDDIRTDQRARRTSVVVCTRARPGDLEASLGALLQLDPAPQEIVVVDNARDGEALASVPEHGPVPVRLVRHDRGGLSDARNAGIATAQGDFLVFTDDDARTHPRWLGALLAGFRHPRVGCVTGMVLPLELATDAQVAFEFGFGGLAGGFLPLEFDKAFLDLTANTGAPVWRIGAGASMAFRREALAQAGPFDPRLGAGASGCSEDSEMWYRLLALGWSCRYEPGAVVFHRHRQDWAGLERQMKSYMTGHVAALLVQYGRHGHRGNLRRILLNLPSDYLRKSLRAALAADRRRIRMLRSEIVGCLKGLRPSYLARLPADGGPGWRP